MKSTKKLLVLLLSLVFLMGAFAVMAFAEEANVATVVYPDGSIETVAVGSQIEPKPFTNGLYNGEGNTLFKDDATEGWLFTVEGEEAALSDLKVTEAMAGKNIIASGADKVYYSITKSGVVTYNMSADTYANDLRNLLRNTPVAQTVMLYEDVTFAATYTWRSTTCTLNFDLNGHLWTITGKASDETPEGKTESNASAGLDCSSNIYIYSSVPGGVVDVPDALYFFRTNNRTVTEINSTERTGYFHIGESETSSGYGKNLTVYCKRVNGDMYSSEAHILGGTYIQRENSTSTYFLVLSRAGSPGQNHFKTIKNATFIVTKKGTSPLCWNHKELTFTNCNFINATESYVPLMTDLNKMTASGNSCGTPTFSGCNFYNVTPVKRDSFTYYSGTTGSWTATYKSDCSFGFSGAVPTADMDTAEATVLYFANAATVVNKEINGQTYAMNAKLITDTSSVLTLDWGDTVDYWEVGAKPYRDAGNETKLENGVIYSEPFFNLVALEQIDANGYVISAGSERVLISYGRIETIAFSYENMSTKEMIYVFKTDGEDAEALGDKFYELFSAPAAAYIITLYQDLYLTKAMGFGPLVASSDSTHNRDYYNSMVNGAITLDLNGRTITIDKNLVGINLAAANYKLTTPGTQNSYKPAVFGFECGSTRNFTLKSSLYGGQIINNSTATLFGVGEGKLAQIKIEDAKNNITIRSKGMIFSNIESSATTPMTIKGGTYIYEGTAYLATVSKGTSLTNATFICTQKTTAFFRVDGYRYNNFNASNCVFQSPSSVNVFKKGDGNSSAFASSSQTSKFIFTDCYFANVAPIEKLSVTYKVSDVSTTFSVSVQYNSPKTITEDHLALFYKDADLSGLVAAYATKAIEGTNYKFVGYYEENSVARVTYDMGFAPEYWLIGQTVTLEPIVLDGIFAYSFSTVKVAEGENRVTAKISGVKPGMMQMSLTLQSQIGMNIMLKASAFANASVKIGGEAVALSSATNGYYVISRSIAPNVANQAITIEITIGDNVHVISCGVDAYAKALINSDSESISMDAKYLTYAMVEYVRAMTGVEGFCNVDAPAGYVTRTLNAQAYAENESNTLLNRIRFKLDDTIAIEIEGVSGKKVNLILASGRSEWGTIDENGSVIFEGLYVNEFYGNMTIKVEEETYTYSLANYLDSMASYADEAVIVALNNYAYYADLYVKILMDDFGIRTFDKSERSRMRDGILALLYSENIDPIKLVKDMYLVAFSASPTLAATPAEVLDGIFSTSEESTPVKMRAIVVPKLYGGSAVDASLDSLFLGARSLPEKADLIVGDLLFVTIGSQTTAYIFDGESLISVMNGCSYVDIDALLASLSGAKRYAVLRPSITLATLRYALPEEELNLTAAQIALIETAKAYLLRGYRQQYDDTAMASNSEYRWQIGQYAPEDYTSQKWGYLNCAAFTYECYRNALGMDLGSRYTTKSLCSHYTSGGTVGASEYPYYYHNSLNVSESDRAAIENAFMSTLEPGDLVVILRKGGYGHVMLYIGNGVLIHSSGSSYDYGNSKETYEPTIRYMNVAGYLFNPNADNYLFREVADEDNGGMRCYIEDLAIVRPLDKHNGSIPENTQNRVNNLSGILSEKLSSHPEGMTVNPGETITFTFRIKNNGLVAKTLEIKDYIPENATLLSAGDFVFANGVLTASVTVAPGATVEASYTVSASGALGSKIQGKNATVGGVLHSCPAIYIEKTLTAAEQAAILAAVAQFRASNPDKLVTFALVNAIYKAAGLDAPFAEGDDVRGSLFKNVTVSGNSLWQLSADSEYYDMVVPTMYGGRKYYTPQKYSSSSKVNTDRSRLPREQALVVGDIIVARFSDSSGLPSYGTYLYIGEGNFVSLGSASMSLDSNWTTTQRLMRLLAVGNYYTILRPSMG